MGILSAVLFFLKAYFFCLLPFILSILLANLLHKLALKTAFLFSVRITSLLYFVVLLFILVYLIIYSSQSLLDYLHYAMIQFPLIYETKILPLFTLGEAFLNEQFHQYSFPSEWVDLFLTTLREFSYRIFQLLLGNVNHVITFFPSLIMFFFITLFSSFLFLLDYEKIMSHLHHFLPHQLSSALKVIQDHFFHSTRQLLLVSLKCSFITFLISFIGLCLLQHSHAFWMALALALVDGIPLVGTSVLLIPWIIGELLLKHLKKACGLAILSLVLMLAHMLAENHFLGRKTGIPPFILFSAIMLSQQFFGFFITLFVPILLILIQDLFHAFKIEKNLQDDIRIE